MIRKLNTKIKSQQIIQGSKLEIVIIRERYIVNKKQIEI